MKRNNPLILCIAIITVCGSLILPSFILDKYIDKNLGRSIQAPNDYYHASASALSKAMSKKLSFSQKLDLITGEWPREIEEVSPDNTDLNPSDYVQMAKEQLKSLYFSGLYESFLDSDIDNWYAYKATLYLCTDATFETYSSYYWVLTFTKYDKSRKHYVLITDTGSVLCAYACPYEETADILSLYLSALSSLNIQPAKDDQPVTIQYDRDTVDTIEAVNTEGSSIKMITEAVADLKHTDPAASTDSEAAVKSRNSYFYLCIFDCQIAELSGSEK